jgi:hypothetical protein
MSRACAVGHVTRTGGYTVGVLVQTNFGGHLTMGGVPVGRELGRAVAAAGGDGWCMIVVARERPGSTKTGPSSCAGTRSGDGMGFLEILSGRGLGLSLPGSRE